jgi:translation initiation factor IF-3
LPEIRLIGAEGEQYGIVSVTEGLRLAVEAGLDLVEIAPETDPPVCKILNYGKFVYEQEKKAKVSKKKQHTVEIKGVRFSSKIGDHDFNFKVNHVRKFIEKGNKCKVWVFFRGREISHQEIGLEVLAKIAQEVSDISMIEQDGMLEGRMMTMLLAPKK